MSSFNPVTFEHEIATVRAEDTASETARRAKRKAEAALFEAVIEKARPVLKAIGTRPKLGEQIRHHADVNYDGGQRTTEHADFRAVLLGGDDEPSWDCPRANEGTSAGLGLWLREDGTLFEVKSSGSWSRWQGSSWGWAATVKEYDSPEAALNDGWVEVGSYVAAIAEAVSAAVGKRTKSIETDRARAEQVAAISALLGKGRR